MPDPGDGLASSAETTATAARRSSIVGGAGGGVGVCREQVSMLEMSAFLPPNLTTWPNYS